MLRATLLAGVSLILAIASLAPFHPGSIKSTSAIPRKAASLVNTLRRVTTTPEEVLNLNPSLSGDGRIVAFETTANLAGAGSGQGFRAIRADLSTGITGVRANGNVESNLSSYLTKWIAHSFRFSRGSGWDKPRSELRNIPHRWRGVSQITHTTPTDISTRVYDGNFQPSISDDGRVIAFYSNRNLTGLNSDLSF